MLTDCTANKILYRSIANWRIFGINAFIMTYVKWKLVLYPFLFKVLFITVICQSQIITSFFDTLAAYECFWGCPFTFAHTKRFTQENAFCNFKYRFDKWRWRKLTFWRNTVMHWRIILKITLNALSRVWTSELAWHLLIIIENFFLMDVV